MNTIREHARIANLVPDAEQIAEPHGDSLGSYIIDKVLDGEFVPLSERHAIEANFKDIDVVSNADLPADYDGYKEWLFNDPKKTALVETLGGLPTEAREQFTAALFAVGVAKNFFRGSFTKENLERRNATGWKLLDETRDDTYKLKKLSETSDDGVCVEYSLMVGEVMKRLDKDTQYTVGYRQDWPDEPGFYHAFLTSDKTSVLIDAYALAQTVDSGKPAGLLLAGEGESIMQKPAEAVFYTDIFGRQATYSAVPIAATTAEQVA